MQNETTTTTTLQNSTVGASGVVGIATVAIDMTDQSSVSVPAVNNYPLPNIRIEGLWVRFVQPWELGAIWAFESVTKSNVEVQNL